MSTSIDWGKMIGGIIAAVLITMQVGLDGSFDDHKELTEKAVEKLEGNTMHKSIVEKNIAAIEADYTLINMRLLKIEREMDSLYDGPGLQD